MRAAAIEEPAPGGRCRVCGSELDESLRCRRCGAAYGERNRCPHCGSVADVEPARGLRQRCRVCGGPRVAVDDATVVRSGREAPLLVKARQAHLRYNAWRSGAVVVGGFGILSVLVTLLVLAAVDVGVLAMLVAFAAALLPLAIAAVAWRRSGRVVSERDEALDQAWALVAGDVLRDKGRELTAEELAQLMRLDPDGAEQLLVELNVHDFVRARVTDAGDVVYESVRPPIEAAELEADHTEHARLARLNETDDK
jgi:hypothetical protein